MDLLLGLLLFHVQDEPALSAWQSGEYYVDGTPKTSLYPVRSAAFGVHRGIVAACPGLLLTPKLVITTGTAGGMTHPLGKVYPPSTHANNSPVSSVCLVMIGSPLASNCTTSPAKMGRSGNGGGV